MPAPLPLDRLQDILGLDEFHLAIDDGVTYPSLRVYHEVCDDDIVSGQFDRDLVDVATLVAAHRCPTISPVEAVDWAVWSVNNFLEPDASSEDQVAEFEKKAAIINNALARIRGFLVASGEDLPDHVFTDDAELGDASVADVLSPVSEKRPLSDFAIHFGLVPVEKGDVPAYVWVHHPDSASYKVDGSNDDQRIPSLPGAYVNGDWEQWGEYAENGTTHLVYDFPEKPWTENVGLLISSLVAWVKDNKGPGRLADVAIITDKADHSIPAGTVYIGGDHPNLVVVPRDWRTR